MDDYDSSQDPAHRYRLSIDTVSLSEEDEAKDNVEDTAIGNFTYIQLVRSLTTDREKFIAIALDLGFEKVDIAFMLKLHPSQITRDTQKMRVKLNAFRKSSLSKR